MNSHFVLTRQGGLQLAQLCEIEAVEGMACRFALEVWPNSCSACDWWSAASQLGGYAEAVARFGFVEQGFDLLFLSQLAEQRAKRAVCERFSEVA